MKIHLYYIYFSKSMGFDYYVHCITNFSNLIHVLGENKFLRATLN